MLVKLVEAVLTRNEAGEDDSNGEEVNNVSLGGGRAK